jgi:hypothetical protein
MLAVGYAAPPMRSPSSIPATLGLAALLLAVGCAPSIGDSCGTALDCSVNGDRTCDLARPGGACTIFACEPDTCPDDAVCVRWRPDPSRLSFTACMRRCTEEGDCRVDEGYACLAAEDIGATEEGGDPIAEVIDEERTDEGTFCVATEPEIPE